MKSNKELQKRVIVTGGGSGGHLSAAQAIIEEIRENYNTSKKNFLYIGGDLGMEGEKIGNSIEQRKFRDAPFDCKYIRAGKLQRSFSFNTIFLLFRTILGFIDSYKIIKKFLPDVVISTGGFVTVPVCLVAKLFKAKIYLHEQTSTVGLSNKIVGRFAEAIFLAYPSSKEFFPKRNTLHVGNLVRKEIFDKKGKGKIVQIIKKMMIEQEEYPIIYISGGSLGSHIINETVKLALHNLLNKYQVILQTGDNKKLRDYDLLLKEKMCLDNHLRDRFYPIKYINNEEIGFLYNNIDLFVGRAGANTVCEIGVLKIPSIFIPIPWVTHNEQFKNAEILKRLGLSIILPEGELSPEQLVLKIDQFIKKEKAINNKDIETTFPLNAQTTILEEINL